MRTPLRPEGQKIRAAGNDTPAARRSGRPRVGTPAHGMVGRCTFSCTGAPRRLAAARSPQKSLAGKLAHPPTPFSFWGQYSTKKAGRQEKSWAGRRGDADWGAYHPAARACRDAPTGGLQAAPTHNGKGPNLLRRGVFSRRFPGGVKTPPYKPPQTAYRIADVPAGRRGGMYAARKAFLRQRGFASRQPVFGCTVGRGLDPAAQCFRCPEGSGPWKRPRAACRPPLHPMADPKSTHKVPPPVYRNAPKPSHFERAARPAVRLISYLLSFISYLFVFPPPFLFPQTVVYCPLYLPLLV